MFLILCALTGAIAGSVSNVPSGALLGSMLACGGLALFLNRNYHYDIRLRLYTQIGLGLVMGQRMTPEIVGRLGGMLFPAVAVTVIMLVGRVLLAFILYRTTGWDMTTCLLCAAPAGLSQVTVFAEEIGVDSAKNDVFWRSANFDFCKKSKFICSRRAIFPCSTAEPQAYHVPGLNAGQGKSRAKAVPHSGWTSCKRDGPPL